MILFFNDRIQLITFVGAKVQKKSEIDQKKTKKHSACMCELYIIQHICHDCQFVNLSICQFVNLSLRISEFYSKSFKKYINIYIYIFLIIKTREVEKA